MNPALHALLDDFGQRHAETRFATDAQGRVVLLFDDRRVVNFIDEPSGLLWALAMIGRLPRGHGDSTDDIEFGEEWVSHTGEIDGFESSISCNTRSGVITLLAKAEPASLDAVAFDQWLSAYLDRLRVTSSVLPQAPH